MTYTFSFSSGSREYSFVYPSKAAYEASEEWWKQRGWENIDTFAKEQNIKYTRNMETHLQMRRAFAICIRWAELWEQRRRMETERAHEAIENASD